MEPGAQVAFHEYPPPDSDLVDSPSKIVIRTALILALAVVPPGAGAAPTNVELSAEDGFTLTATLWQEDAGAPGLLLFHQCDADRSMYDGLGQKLADAGFRVLALDFRGFGDSTGDGFDLAKHGSREDRDRIFEKLSEDAEAAYRYLTGQGEGAVVAALGASCGGAQVIKLAGTHRELRLLVLLSARLDALAERDALRLPGPSMLFITSKGDMSARRPAGTINYRTQNTDLMLLEGESHGHPLFAENPGLEDSIVDWFVAGLAELE